MARPGGPEQVDAIVVGAGPAGSSAAIELRRRRPGWHVVLLDRAAFPRDKACGDAIAVHAFDELARMGVHGVEGDAEPVHELRLTAPDGSVVVGRCARPNRIIPREVFDARLVDVAVGAGANLRQHRVRHVAVDAEGVTVDGRFRAPVLIAADGANSVVRQRLGIPGPTGRHRAIAVRAYASGATGPTGGWGPSVVDGPRMVPGAGVAAVGSVGPVRGSSGTAGESSGTAVGSTGSDAAQHIEFLAEGWPAYAWSFPLGGGRANIGYGLRVSALGGHGRDTLVARLVAALPDQVIEEGTIAVHPLPFSSGRPTPGHGRVLLAGDAAGLINPLTGEGIFYAIASGRMAAIAVTTASGTAVGARHTALLSRRLGRHLATTTVLARLLDQRWLLPLAIRAAQDPAVFADVAEIGLGEGTLTPRLVRALAGAALTR